MPRKPRDVTDTELAILRLLWDAGPQSVRALAGQLYPTDADKQVPTVQTLLTRLEGKGYVARDRGVWPHSYTAAVEREQLLGRRLETTAEELCGGSFGPMLSYLVRGRPLSEDERTLLRDLLADLDREDSAEPEGQL